MGVLIIGRYIFNNHATMQSPNPFYLNLGDGLVRLLPRESGGQLRIYGRGDQCTGVHAAGATALGLLSLADFSSVEFRKRAEVHITALVSAGEQYFTACIWWRY